MKIYVLAGMTILSLLVGACGTPTSLEPTLGAEDVQATAIAAAFTIVAETQAAIPTNTDIPPTEPPVPTETSVAVPTIPSPTALELPTTTPTSIPTFTALPPTTAANADPCNKHLSSWQGPSVDINIVYDYKPQGKDDKVVLSLWVMTDQGECGFLSDYSTGPVGQYSALALVDGPKDFKATGGFRLTEAAWNIVIRNDTIVALGSCYPGC